MEVGTRGERQGRHVGDARHVGGEADGVWILGAGRGRREGFSHVIGGGFHDGAVEGGVAFDLDGARVVAAVAADLGQQLLDALQRAREHDLVLRVDVGDQHLLDGWDIGRVVFGARVVVPQEVVDRRDERVEAFGLADQRDHAVRVARGFVGGAGTLFEDLGASADHAQCGGVGEVSGCDEGGIFAKGVAEGYVDMGGDVEREFFFEDAGYHDRGGHDGGLRI